MKLHHQTPPRTARPRPQDDARYQPPDDMTSRPTGERDAAYTGQPTAVDPPDALQRAQRGSRDVDAPRRGAPPGVDSSR